MPTTNTIERPQQVYQIKVTLLGTDPPIWRRLLVPADLTLEQLHNVLQIAMGWEDCHMHEFRIGQQLAEPLYEAGLRRVRNTGSDGAGLWWIAHRQRTNRTIVRRAGQSRNQGSVHL